MPDNNDVGLGAPFNYYSPDFNPSSATSAAATGASFTDPKLKTSSNSKADFTSVTYKGACAVGDTWWKSWTSFK